MRFASLGSGSAGNALIVECGATRVLVDCGFGVREATRRLGRLGIALEDIAAILITHEHGDHAGGAVALSRRRGIPLLLTPGTRRALRLDGREVLRDVAPVPFALGDLEIVPFPVPHDAREPVQYVLGDGRHRLGVLTDLGQSTPHVEAMLSGCDALVLECNHDRAMLLGGPYPAHLKARVGGRLGHLDNESSAALLARLDRSRLQHLVAAHLSARNNTPQLAREALARVMGCAPGWVGVADQDEGFGWRGIG